jgi:hypothetical protein
MMMLDGKKKPFMDMFRYESYENTRMLTFNV